MAFPSWSKSNEKDLARYALADIGDEIRLASPTADLLAAGDLRRIVEELYQAFAAMDIRWSRERYDPNLTRQEVRNPRNILNGSGDGTCLDLALLFAGAALGKDLLPLVVVLDGHAFVAVSLTTGRRHSGGSARVRDDGNWVETGLLSGSDARERLLALAVAGRYVLVECTGFAQTSDALPPVMPEGKGRENGLLSFERAIQAGVEQLETDSRPFAFAVDIAFLQDVAELKPYDEQQDGLDELEPDLRRRQNRLLQDYTLVAGRDAEIEALDRFVTGTSAGYCLVTGDPGVGKTALLAEWTRRLQGRSELCVVYHFLSRPYGTADDQYAFLQSIVQQASWAWRKRDRAVGTLAQLETRWLELLDAANVPPNPVIIVIDGIDEAAGWNVQKSILPKYLPDGVHIVLSARAVAGVDWARTLDIPASLPLQVQKLDDDAAKAIARRAQVPDWLLADRAFEVLTDRAQGDPFYLRLLCDLVLQGHVSSTEELAQHAKGLDNHVQTWWDELKGVADAPSVRCLLSYLTVTLAPITRAELLEIDEDDALDGFTFDGALDRINRYVTGDVLDDGISLAHWRLNEYIGRVVLPPAQRRKTVDKIVAWCDRWDDHHLRYALKKGFSHHLVRLDLLPAADRPAAKNALVRLLGDSGYQRARVEKADDTAGLIADFNRIVSVLANEFDSAAEDLIESSLQRIRARSKWLQPSLVFDLADQGRYDDAMQGVAVLSGAGSWRSLAEVSIAWIAARRGDRENAARLLPDVLGNGPPLGVLAQRVRHAIDATAPEPQFSLPYPPGRLPDQSDVVMAERVVERFGAIDAEHGTYRGLPSLTGIPYSRGRLGAETDAPIVVAAARDTVDDDALLTEYIELHASNPYASYRDRSLWVILGAVACLPDADQALKHVRRLCEGAFAPTHYWFAEFLGLTAAALRPGSGSAFLERERTDALAAAAQLNAQTSQLSGGLHLRPADDVGASDQWSYLQRRLCAHAEQVASSERGTANFLLLAAQALPGGFAGYQAPACLSLAEACHIVDKDDVARRSKSLDLALTAAHNIQDPSFCARTTAQVNAITRLWDTPPHDDDLDAMVERLVSESGSIEFAATHVVGDTYDRRRRFDHLPIDGVTDADSFVSLAVEVFQMPPGQLHAANPQLSGFEHPGTEVRVPDPTFVPIVAGWLSAQIVASTLPQADRARLIARLVPVAGSNPTVLDTILARLLYVSPGQIDLDRVDAACELSDSVEPPAGFEYKYDYYA